MMNKRNHYKKIMINPKNKSKQNSNKRYNLNNSALRIWLKRKTRNLLNFKILYSIKNKNIKLQWNQKELYMNNSA
jgi:hypothetical protein